jgi:hypothetical protein
MLTHPAVERLAIVRPEIVVARIMVHVRAERGCLAIELENGQRAVQERLPE